MVWGQRYDATVTTPNHNIKPGEMIDTLIQLCRLQRHILTKTTKATNCGSVSSGNHFYSGPYKCMIVKVICFVTLCQRKGSWPRCLMARVRVPAWWFCNPNVPCSRTFGSLSKILSTFIYKCIQCLRLWIKIKVSMKWKSLLNLSSLQSLYLETEKGETWVPICFTIWTTFPVWDCTHTQWDRRTLCCWVCGTQYSRKKGWLF